MLTPIGGLGLPAPPGFVDNPASIPATVSTGNAIMSALSIAGGIPRRQWVNNFGDAAIKSWLGGGAITVVATLTPPDSSLAIVPYEYFKLTSNVVQFTTPGATTPGLRFPNSNLGATVAMTLANNDNPPANQQQGRLNTLSFTNAAAYIFTSPQLFANQPMQLVMTNAGAQWTGGDPGNFMDIVITYLLWSHSLLRFV